VTDIANLSPAIFAAQFWREYGPSATDMVNDEVRGAMIDGDAERACFWMLVRGRLASQRMEN